MATKVIKLPRIDGQIELKMKVPNKDKPIVMHVRRAFMEEIVADMIALVGDGKARISVSCDMSAKDFGNGAGVNVAISVSCNQDEATINQAVDMLGVKVRLLAKEQLTLAGVEYNALMKSAVPEWNNG